MRIEQPLRNISYSGNNIRKFVYWNRNMFISIFMTLIFIVQPGSDEAEILLF